MFHMIWTIFQFQFKMQYRFRKVRIFLMASLCYFVWLRKRSKELREYELFSLLYSYWLQMSLCPFERKAGHYFKVVFNMLLYKNICHMVSLSFHYLSSARALCLVFVCITLDCDLGSLCFVFWMPNLH
jgi:hypothetical protein